MRLQRLGLPPVNENFALPFPWPVITSNVFSRPEIAAAYDAYYREGFGRQVDEIEKGLVAGLLKDVPRQPMLELGCGTGHWTEYFVTLGFEVSGIDTSEAMLEQARRKNLAAQFRQASAEDIPFPDESFEMVSSITMLEFVDDPLRVFDQINRVLAPGGTLLLGCLNADSRLARNNGGDEVFADAKFMHPEQLIDCLSVFGKPELSFGVHLAEDFSLLDGTIEQIAAEPVFMAARVKKEQ